MADEHRESNHSNHRENGIKPDDNRHTEHGQDNGSEENRHADHHTADFARRFWISLIVTIPVLALSPLIQDFLGFELTFTGDAYVLWVLSVFIYVYGGQPFLTGLKRELSQHNPGMMTLIAMAISVAFFYSSAVTFGLEGEVFYWELATLVDIMLLGHWLEMRSIMSASRALDELAKLLPAAAHRLRPEGKTEEIPIKSLVNNDRVLIKPGEKIPADGKVESGESTADESMLTGESMPVSKGQGDQVFGGSTNGDGSLTVTVSRTGEESYLAQMAQLVGEAQASKSRAQNTADRAARWLTFIALFAGLATLAGWLLLSSQPAVFAIERMVTVMVIACPHALGLAVPLVIAASTGLAARNGLLIRNRISFESAHRIDAVVFDKTGTLTQGKFGVTDSVVLDEKLSREELLNYTAAVESHSAHPIAQGIVASAQAKEPYEVTDFKSLSGRGARGRVREHEVIVASPDYVAELGLDYDNQAVAQLLKQGKTLVFTIIDRRVSGAVALADIIRPESAEVIAGLKKLGKKIIMMTGDREEVASWVASELKLDEFFSGVLPEDKSSRIKNLQARGLSVAMTGDGVNDAPALAQADLGMAVGTGADIARATADVILVRSNPSDVMSIFDLSRLTSRKIRQNLGWATGYNALAIPAAAGLFSAWGVMLSPAVGAALMSLSTIIVAVNARLLRL